MRSHSQFLESSIVEGCHSKTFLHIKAKGYPFETLLCIKSMGDFLLILIAARGDPTDFKPSYKKPWFQRPGAIPLKVMQPPTP